MDRYISAMEVRLELLGVPSTDDLPPEVLADVARRQRLTRKYTERHGEVVRRPKRRFFRSHDDRPRRVFRRKVRRELFEKWSEARHKLLREDQRYLAHEVEEAFAD